MTQATKPLPDTKGPEAPFWKGLTEGEVRVLRCEDCGNHYFPRPAMCRNCRGANLTWTPVEARGEVESFCVFHRPYFPGFDAEMPYAVIQVKLGCGVRLFSNPVGITNDELKIGMPVRGVFEKAGSDVTLLKFAPITKENR
jgi:uncharacterized protein